MKLDQVAPTSSVVDSMLVFSVLAVVGVVWTLRKSRERTNPYVLSIPLAATLVGSVATLSFGYLSQRYLTDFMPLLLLSSLIGLNASIEWFRSSTPVARQIACVSLVALVAANVWLSVGIAGAGEERHLRDERCAVVSLVRDCDTRHLTAAAHR